MTLNKMTIYFNTSSMIIGDIDNLDTLIAIIQWKRCSLRYSKIGKQLLNSEVCSMMRESPSRNKKSVRLNQLDCISVRSLTQSSKLACSIEDMIPRRSQLVLSWPIKLFKSTV